MVSVIREKAKLWRQLRKGASSRISSKSQSPAVKRDDVSNLILNTKLDRGDKLQKARLKYYPSIDVDYDALFAGRMKGSLEDAENRLQEMGYRNNPTAYVEITDNLGPDEGSYARQFITEIGGRFDVPAVGGFPSYFRRIKQQVHVTIYKNNDHVDFLAHEEKSAWLQPVRHVAVPMSSARVGVREFRNDWRDIFDEELKGKQDVKWNVSN